MASTTIIDLPAESSGLTVGYAGRFTSVDVQPPGDPDSRPVEATSTRAVTAQPTRGGEVQDPSAPALISNSQSSSTVSSIGGVSTAGAGDAGGAGGAGGSGAAGGAGNGSGGAVETTSQSGSTVSVTATTSNNANMVRRAANPIPQAPSRPQSTLQANFTALIAGPSATSTLLSGDFVLYLPFSVTAGRNVTWSSLLDVLTTPYPGNAPSGASNLAALQLVDGSPVPIATPVVSLAANSAIYIPVTNALTASLAVADGISALRTAALAIPTDQNDAETGSPDPTPGGESVPDRKSTSYSAGALAGGIIGAFIAAVLVCGLIAFFCIRRRRSRRFRSDARSSGSSNDYALADMARNPEKSQAVVAASSVTGWQKHLPQEKDDGTIIKLFKSIFEQAQMHMEGYYGSNTQDLSDAAIATLRELSEDDLPLMLPQTQKQVLLLEGILLRFMIRRISGRSDVHDSFLPSDLSRIAKNNGWYMERESGRSGIDASGKKRGFSQALAQWRQLTGFLLPNYRDDQAYQNELRTKIEAAVQNIDSAYSPWKISGKSSDKRRESLRGILQQVSDAGILLFTQPSTFLFDWSTPAQSDSRTVAISPALLRENEGSAREDVLIKGSQGKL